jgi:hypothetical protein
VKHTPAGDLFHSKERFLKKHHAKDTTPDNFGFAVCSTLCSQLRQSQHPLRIPTGRLVPPRRHIIMAWHPDQNSLAQLFHLLQNSKSLDPDLRNEAAQVCSLARVSMCCVWTVTDGSISNKHEVSLITQITSFTYLRIPPTRVSIYAPRQALY